MRTPIRALAIAVLASSVLSVVPAAHAVLPASTLVSTGALTTDVVAQRLAEVLEGRPGGARPLVLTHVLGNDVVPGVLLVTTTGDGALAGVRAAAERLAAAAAAGTGTGRAASTGTRSLSGRVAQVDVVPGDEEAAAAVLAAQPGVVAVEPARYRHQLASSSDPLYPRQWAHRLGRVEPAWDVTTGSAAVKVAVIDSGVDARHPDLRGNVTSQQVFSAGTVRSVATGSDNRQCGGDHATHVAGIVGARGDDGVGVAGVAWSVSLLDLAVFTPSGAGCAASDADIIGAIRAATRSGADVINLSLGGAVPEPACSTAYQTVIDEARAAGVVVVAASGNSELDRSTAGQAFVPASCNGVVSVGAATVTGVRAPYSTTNPQLDLVAPGGDSTTGLGDGVLSTTGDGGHGWYAGTSMAAPYVAGTAALLLAVDPALTPDQVEGLLEAGARDVGTAGRDPQHGWGLVDTGRSVRLAAAGTRPVPAPDPVFPVGGSGADDPAAPPSTGPQVFRVSAGTGVTSAVPQAVAMSRAVFADGAATHAVLARRDVAADALAGSSLGLGLGPLLFASSTGPLPTSTRAELLRVLPPGRRVFLLGGPDALPATLEAELSAMGLVAVRVAGRDREQTAVAVATQVDRLRAEQGLPDQEVVFLTTGSNWPDAVTAGSLGAYFGVPILLTAPGALHPDTAQALRARQPAVLLVLGGSSAVDDATFAAAATAAGTGTEDTVRIAGPDRYATAVRLAELFEAVLASTGVSPRCVIAANLVRADGFAHVLSATSMAGAFGCVVVPAEGPSGDRLPAVTRQHVSGFGVDGILAGDRDVLAEATGSDLSGLLQP